MKVTKATLFFQFCLLWFGIFGSIFCFLDTFKVAYQPLFVYASMLFFILFFMWLYYHKKYWRKVSWIIGILTLVFVISNISALRVSVLVIANNILSAYTANSQQYFSYFKIDNMEINLLISNTKLIIFVVGLLSMLCVRSICERQGYVSVFALSFPFLFSIILFTLQPNWIAFMMVMVFWLTLLFMHLASHHKTFSTNTSTSTIGMISMISLTLLMIGIYWIVPPTSYQRATWVELTRMQLQTEFQELINGIASSDSGELDLATARNRYYSGRVDLLVTSEQPQTMYLRGFSASIYQDNRWSNPPVEEYRKRLDSTLMRMNPFHIVTNALRSSKLVDIPTTYRFQVVNQYGNDNYVYTPYYIASDVQGNDQVTTIMDAYLEGNEGRNTAYEFDIWKLGGFDMNRLLPNLYQIAYQRMNTKYTTDVPAHLQSMFAELRIPGMQEAISDEDKINVIKNYLSSITEYTLMPGDTPGDVDFVEYFLKTNKKGYCVHYATTATLLFRYYGIPARYVEGYHIGKGDFVGNEANVKDFTAHAWVEVADLQYGWIPVEVTPPSATASGNGSSSPQVNPNPTPETPTPTPEQNDPDSPTQAEQNPTNTPTAETSNASTSTLNWYYIMIPLGCILGLSGYGGIVRIRRKHAFHQADNRNSTYAYAKYLSYFHNDTSYPDEILTILEKARFSKHSISDAELESLCNYTTQCIATAKHHAPAWKNLWYRMVLARY